MSNIFHLDKNSKWHHAFGTVSAALLLVTGMLSFLLPAPFQTREIIPPLSVPSAKQPLVAYLAPRIFINGTNSSQDWDDCPWVNGSGTFVDPYVLGNLTIDGDLNGSCIFITNTQEYLRVENCTVRNSGAWPEAGIWLLNVTNANLRNNTCTENDGDGIALSSASNNTLSENTCTGNSGDGICIDLADNNKFSENICTENAIYGIHLYSSGNNYLTGNNCSQNYNAGIFLYSAGNNTLLWNNCSRNYDDGIYLNDASNNTLSGNNCSQNSYDGIYLYSSDNNTLSGNNCTWNYYNGILLQGASNTTLLGNNCSRNYHEGIYVNLSDNNTLSGNDCTWNYDNGILLEWASNTTLAGNNCTGSSKWGILIYYSPNCTITGNVMERGGLFLDESASYALSTFIDATNTVNGNPVQFLASTSGVTIPTNTGEVILVNCTGITVNQLSNPGIFIHLINSSSNFITGNDCTGSPYGIFLGSSNNNTISGNNCTQNAEDGIYLYSSDNNIVSENSCTQNAEDGISLYSSYKNTVSENNCTQNAENGIYLFYSYYNQLSGNNCTQNAEDGISLYSSYKNTVSENNCTQNAENGIYLFYSYYNQLSGNNCSGNFWEGISLDSSNNNNLTRNNCSENDDGIYLTSSDYNIISGNNCSGNANYGFYLSGSNYNEIFLNYARNNGIRSIYELNCRYNNIHNNYFGLIPWASFRANLQWFGLSVGFWGNCSDGDAPFTYQWDFGDGSPNSTQQYPTHQYGAAGTYTVVLTITDFDGHVSVSIQIITVNDWTWIVILLAAAGVGIIAWIRYRKRKYGRERPYTPRSVTISLSQHSSAKDVAHTSAFQVKTYPKIDETTQPVSEEDGSEKPPMVLAKSPEAKAQVEEIPRPMEATPVFPPITAAQTFVVSGKQLKMVPSATLFRGQEKILGTIILWANGVESPSTANIGIIGSYKTSKSVAEGVAVSGTVVYVADWYSGLQCIDVSNPAAPALLESVATSGYALGVAVSGTVAYVATGGSGLQCIDVSKYSIKPDTVVQIIIIISISFSACLVAVVAWRHRINARERGGEGPLRRGRTYLAKAPTSVPAGGLSESGAPEGEVVPSPAGAAVEPKPGPKAQENITPAKKRVDTRG